MDDHQSPESSDYSERLAREEVLVRQAEASLDRGDFITMEALTAWAESLDTENELPLPAPDHASTTSPR